MEFPGMAGDGLLAEERAEQRHYRVKNLDHFFTSMYRYYVSKGIGAVLLSELCSVLSLAFTVLFTGFLFAFVDWTALLECHDEDSCGDLDSTAFIINPLHHTPTKLRFFLFLYLLLAFMFWIRRCYTAMQTISDAMEMAHFYREKLGLQLVDLQAMQWFEVVQRLIDLHEQGVHRVAVKETLSVQDVVLRIMRKENYLIAMINKNHLDLYVPWWMSPFSTNQFFLTQSLEWSLSFCIMDYMFNDQFEISAEFLHDVGGLQWRFQVVGLIHFLLLPFMLFYMMVEFFLQNAQQFHSSGAYLGPRQWNPLALWKFREFNELPHIFEERIKRSLVPANEYLRGFRNPYVIILARCGMYIVGGLIATLLLISALSEGALLYLHIMERNLLWYLGVLSAAYAALNSLVPDDTKVAETPECLLKRVGAHTHYYPAHWAAGAASVDVKDEVCDLFQYKSQLFVMEVCSVVLTPLVLCFSLPACAKTVLDFIRDHSRYVDGVGVVCDYSLFDFERYGDENYGAAKSGYLDENQRMNDGKLEKSFMNFQRAYPNYVPPDACRNMSSNIHAFIDINRQQREQMVASALERSNLVPMHLGDMNPLAASGEGDVGGGQFSSNLFSPRRRLVLRHRQPASPLLSQVVAPQQLGQRVVVDSIERDGTVVGHGMEDRIGSTGHAHISDDSSADALLHQHHDSTNITTGKLFNRESPTLPMVSSLVTGAPHSGGSIEDRIVLSREVSEQASTYASDPVSDVVPNEDMQVLQNGKEIDPATIEMSYLSSSLNQRHTGTVLDHPDPLRDVVTNRSLLNSDLPSSSVFDVERSSEFQAPNGLPSMLMSILRQENIDYENDFYWMDRFNHERVKNSTMSTSSSMMDRSLLPFARRSGHMRMTARSPRSPTRAALGNANNLIGIASTRWGNSSRPMQYSTTLSSEAGTGRQHQQPYLTVPAEPLTEDLAENEREL